MEADPTLPVRESRAAESQENKRKNTKAKVQVQVQAQPTTITVALAALLLFRDDSNNISIIINAYFLLITTPK